MSQHLRALVLLVPALGLMAADSDPAPAPLPAAAPAAHDGTLNNLDLRFTLGGGGGLVEVENEDTDAKADYEDGASGTVAVHVLYLRARPGGIGFVVGGGLSAHSYEGEPEGGGPTSTVNAVGIDVYAGFVYRPTRNWHFELPAMVLSAGAATVETDGLDDSDEGGYARFAIQVGAYYTFDFGLQLGLDLGAAGFGTTVDQEVSPGVEQEISYRGGGGYANLTIGYRF